MYNFREVNKTNYSWEAIENVEIRLTKENNFILVVTNPRNNLEYTKLNTLFATSLEEAKEEATNLLRSYDRRALINMYQ